MDIDKEDLFYIENGELFLKEQNNKTDYQKLETLKNALRNADETADFGDIQKSENELIFEVRWWGDWEVSDADRYDSDNEDEDFSDWDWKVLTDKWYTKLHNIVSQIEAEEHCHFNIEIGEKEYIYCGIQKTEDLNEDVPLDETYSEEELHDMVGKVYNQQRILNIYRRQKYGDKKLYAHTRCTECGREKKVFLSNLVNDPDKYGSCVCSDANIESKIDRATDLYDGSLKLTNNTSGHTGVSFIKTYRGESYNKWRAYIDQDGKRTYLGDFNEKRDAIKAREEAAKKGVRWYKLNKSKIKRNTRSKYKRSRKLRGNTKKH